MGIATFPASSGGLASAVKSVQRGEAVSAGNITITSVVVAKTQVTSFSTGSAGTVAATGAISAANGTTSGISTSGQTGTNTLTFWQGQVEVGGNITGFPFWGGSSYNLVAPGTTPNIHTYQGGRYGQTTVWYSVSPGTQNMAINLNGQNTNGMNVGLNATNISGGSTSLTAATYGAYLTNSTTLTTTGPCRYEVVEYF